MEPELSEEELKQLWYISKQGIDLEELEKTVGELIEILKPTFQLYRKNIETYKKYKK